MGVNSVNELNSKVKNLEKENALIYGEFDNDILGFNISERREQMLEELEKAHIYIEQLNNNIKELEETNKQLIQRIEKIEKSINK